jgi:hypothetical protein
MDEKQFPSSFVVRGLLLGALALLAACGVSGGFGQSERVADSGDVLLSFVYVGCNRVGWSEEVDPATGAKVPLPPSTANKPQLLQTFRDVANELDPAPAYLFLCGDIVRNEQARGGTLEQQLADWQVLWRGGALAEDGSTVLVPFPGNHEVLKSVEYAPDTYYEVPNRAAYATWLSWLNTHGHFPTTGNGPAAGGADLLVDDNGKLSYSFRASMSGGRQAHFVVLNTDSHSSFACDDPACYQPPQRDVPFGGKTVQGTMHQAVPGWIALDWATKDVAAAVADPAVDAVFVLGHKPLLNRGQSPGVLSTGRDTVFNGGDHKLANGLFEALQRAQVAGKFGGYLCAHQHLWDAFPMQGEQGPALWQVIAGNGGTELDKGDEFGFTYVQIHQSGKITATAYGRKVPASYYYAPTDAVARPGQRIVLREPK